MPYAGGGRVGLGIVKNLTIQFDFDSLGRNSIQYQFNIDLNAWIFIQWCRNKQINH